MITINPKNKLVKLIYSIISSRPIKNRISGNTIAKAVLKANRLGLLDTYNHYKDQYWNDLELVQRYINKNATGNENTIWQIDILTRFKTRIPFENVLIIGCGNGWVERQLYDLGIGLHFEAFDITEKYLKEARSLAGSRDIHYFKADINNLDDLGESKYDAIFNVAVLHHTFRIANTVWNLYKALKQNGLMFNFDYVGPARNQYSDKHLEILQSINLQLMKRFQSVYPLRPAKENFYFGDPTEAVHSDLVRPTIERFFDIIYQRDLNGGIAYQILWNNINEFKKNDQAAIDALEFLLKKDAEYTKLDKVPVLFWYSVGTPKPKKSIAHWITLSS